MAVKPSLFEKMAKLYSRRNKLRDKFARIDRRDKIGVEDPVKFNKWLATAKDLIDTEKELLNEKVSRLEEIYPFSTKAESLSDKIYEANKKVAYKDIHKKQSDLFDEILADWIDTPDGQKWISSRPADGHDRGRLWLPYEQSKILEDANFDLRSRKIEDDAFDISDNLRSSENVANSVSKDFAKKFSWDDNFHMPHRLDIQFKDSKGVKHDPTEYYYGSSFGHSTPWHRGKGLSDEDIRLLKAFD